MQEAESERTKEDNAPWALMPWGQLIIFGLELF
jgi:hypothetical protein